MKVKIPNEYKMMLYKGKKSEYEPDGDIHKLPTGSKFRIYNKDWRLILDYIDERYIVSDNMILEKVEGEYMYVQPDGLPYLENINGGYY